MQNEKPVKMDGNISPERRSRPRFAFTGPVGSPDIPVPQVAENIHAHFNPGMARIKIPSGTAESGYKDIGVTFSRIMTRDHVEGRADTTQYVGISTYEFTKSGITTNMLGAIEAKNLLTPELQQEGYNIEDFRLTYLENTNKLLCSVTVASAEGRPYLGMLTATPYAENDQLGFHFGQCHILKDGNGNRIEGKNNIARVNSNGDIVVMYRPEHDEERGRQVDNDKRFAFISVDIQDLDKPVQPVGKEIIFPNIEEKRARWGWNGENGQHTLHDEEGLALSIVHYDKKHPTDALDDIYVFKLAKCKEVSDGTLELVSVSKEDFLTPDDVRRLTPTLPRINSHKDPIYSPGSDIDEVNQQFVMGVAIDDVQWGYLSVPISDMQTFAQSATFVSASLE